MIFRGLSQKEVIRDFKGLKRLWPFLREERVRILLAATLIPIISVLQMAQPLLLKSTIDRGISAGETSWLQWGAGFFFLAVLGEYASRSGQRWISVLVVQRMIFQLRMKLVGHVLGLPARFHDRSLSGTLVTRATSDFDGLSDSLNQGVLTSAVDLVVLVGVVLGLFSLDWRFALLVLSLLPILGLFISTFSTALKRAITQARSRLAQLNAFSQECLHGLKTVKLLNAQAHAEAQHQGLTEEYRKAQMKSVVLDAVMFAMIDGLSSITLGFVFWFAAQSFFTLDGLTPGVLIALVAFIQQLFEPLKQLGSKMALMQGAFTAIDRIFRILEEKDHIQGEIAPPPRLKGHLVAKNLSFAYHQPNEEKDPPEVLQDVDFDLPPGQSLAIVGRTGSGKSSLVRILTKLYDGYKGQLQIDHQELRTLQAETYRARIGMVPQEIALFEGSIGFNISLHRPGIDEKAIRSAAQTVGAHSFIEALPGQYDFILKEQGSNLSQGQRQLIAFARALVGDPCLVVLDEATSSVDPQSEQIIQEAIPRILDHRSAIIIAHRLSTIEKCDQILVIEKGRVAQRGTHQELLEDPHGPYGLLHRSLA